MISRSFRMVLQSLLQEETEIGRFGMQLYRLRNVQETIDHAVDAFDFFQRNGAGLVNIRIIGRLLAHLHAKPDGRQRISNLMGNAGNQPSQAASRSA